MAKKKKGNQKNEKLQLTDLKAEEEKVKKFASLCHELNFNFFEYIFKHYERLAVPDKWTLVSGTLVMREEKYSYECRIKKVSDLEIEIERPIVLTEVEKRA